MYYLYFETKKINIEGVNAPSDYSPENISGSTCEVITRKLCYGS